MFIRNGKAWPTETDTEILGFFKQYRPLSNFWVCNVDIEGLIYPSSEHAYMAMKTIDAAQRLHLSTGIEKAVDAKAYGQIVTLRPDWEEVKYQMMVNVLFAKFNQNLELKRLLLATGTKRLEETNWWSDRYWGVCGGTGLNKLGEALMEVRARLVLENLVQEQI